MSISLHLGSGADIKKGWLNVDMLDINNPDYVKWDLKNGLPPQAQNLSVVYSQHFFEHLQWEDGLTLMKRCKERMVEGGTFRLALPNFKTMVMAYLDNNWEFFNLPEVMAFAPNRQMMQIMNYGLYQHTNGVQEHVCQFDPAYALFTMRSAGFRECKEVAFNPLYDSDLEVRKRYTFYCEGIK